MKNQSFLTFSLRGMLLGIDATAVSEIIWLPELTMIEECPSYICGIFNMRGKIVPVMDLDIRFGHAPKRYNCTDRLIVLSISEFNLKNNNQQALSMVLSSHVDLMGIIVNEVLDVVVIPEENIEPSPFESNVSQFVKGEAKSGGDIIMILDPVKFFDQELEIKKSDIEEIEINTLSVSGYFCPGADQKEREIFHKRAVNLKDTSDQEDREKLIPAVVVTLNNEKFCIGLEVVREFSKINNFIAVPCCPEHVAGNMNLRGNVLTLVDISGLLNLQPGTVSDSTKVIVAEAGEFPVGVIVDEINDIVYLREIDIIQVPLSTSALNEKFIIGAAPYDGRMMVILDLKEILSWDGLIVNEEV